MPSTSMKNLFTAGSTELNILSSQCSYRVVLSIGWLAAITLILAGCAAPPASESATPSSRVTVVNDEDVERYARAIILIEPKRKAAHNEIQRITQSEQVPDFTCTQPDKISALANNIEKIAVNYCNQAKEIGQGQGLTMIKFNEITRSAQSDPALQKRIETELLRLQYQ